MKPGFELFQHTADAGIRVFAPALPLLLWPAAQALYSVIGELQCTEEVLPNIDIALPGEDPAMTLRHFLAELLFLFEAQSVCAVGCRSSAFDMHGLQADLEMRKVDRDRSLFHAEVKAVTYHELALCEKADPKSGDRYFEACLVVDL